MMFALPILVLGLAQSAPSPPLIDQARKDFASGHYAEARVELGRAIQQDPKDATLWFYLGASCMKLSQTDPAIGALEHTVALAPWMAPAYFNLGLLYWRKGDLGKATTAYEKGLRVAPRDLDANENLGLLLMNLGKYPSAVEPLERAKQLDGSNLSIRAALVEAYLKSGQNAAAGKEVEEILSANVATPPQQVKLAATLVQNHAPALAEKVLRNAMAADANLASAHGAWGLMLLQKNQYEDSVRELGRAVQLDPDSSEYAMGLAEALLLWRHNDTLLSFLKAIEPRFGKQPEFQYKLALAYYGLAQYPNAIDALTHLLKTNPPRPDVVRYFLGNSYLAMGKFPEAEDCYRKAIETNPKDPSYYESYTTLLRKLSSARLDEAIGLLEKARQLDPSSASPKLQLALCYESKRELAQAQSLLEDALREQPDLLPAHVALARVYFHEGKKPQGEQEKVIVTRLEAAVQKKKLELKSEPDALVESTPSQ